jgi:putative sugar O-methyltransferase
MQIKPYLKKVEQSAIYALNSLLEYRDYKLIDSRLLYGWQKSPEVKPAYNRSALPEGASDYLHKNNPKLDYLNKKYDTFNTEVTTPLVWTDAHVKPDDVVYFRGDNAYVWQLRGQNMNIMGYALTTYYVKSIDRLISRDLLDSIMEIYFLEKHLNISTSSKTTILDIGAGYGRLAHRMASAIPQISSYLCTDAVAISSFISDYYIKFRKLEKIAKVIGLDAVEKTLDEEPVDIAINIHSFSECKLSAIDWWLSLLSRYKVRYLMIVPNAGDHGGDRLLTHENEDFGQVIEKYGYKLIAKEPKFRDPVVQTFGINPTYHYLFELQ